MTSRSDFTHFGLRKIVFFLTTLLCSFTGALAQEMQEEQPAQGSYSPREESTSPAQNQITIGGGMWGQQNPTQEVNPQAGSNNSEDVNSDAESGGSAAPAPSPGRGGIRRTTTIGGVTRENGTNPAGNPDEVPFDDNMNIFFLLSGLIFAYLVIRKRNLSQRAASH